MDKLIDTRVSWFFGHQRTIDVDYFSPICPKRYFSDANVGKLQESNRTTLPFRHVCLWHHNHLTREIGRVAYHPPPCGWQAGHCGQIVRIILWIWKKGFLCQLFIFVRERDSSGVIKLTYQCRSSQLGGQEPVASSLSFVMAASASKTEPGGKISNKVIKSRFWAEM